LTVLFCDLVGSTALSEQLDPEEYREVVRAYQTTCTEVIRRYAGHTAQHLGDGLLVYFSYPVAHEDDAQRAVRTGLEILAGLQPLNVQLPPTIRARLPHPIQVRIGIHTGLVVIGEIGSSEKREILAMGETPNIAARLQGLAEPDTVVISGATYRLVQGLFECQDRGLQELKDISTLLPVYRVLRESAAQNRFEVAVRTGLTPLVGRDLEVGLLQERWAQAKGGEGQVVLLSGEAGIGKSYEVAYLFIDAVYEPLRRWGSKTGVLCVWAICVDGRKVLLSLSTANSESYESCLEVLRDLLKRGLPTPVTITTDGAGGLTKAIDAIWPKSLRLRCWFHKMQNLQQKVPPQAWPEFKALVIDMRDAPSVEEAQRRRHEMVKRYGVDFPEACRCLLDDAQASLNHLYVPPRHQPYVRTSNLAERAFEEERRRTKVIPQLWEEGGLVKLVFAVLIRVSERWGKKCFSEFEQQQIRSLRRKLELDDHEVSTPTPTTDAPSRRSAASAA
jgi:class 3 adenylate cyclase